MGFTSESDINHYEKTIIDNDYKLFYDDIKILLESRFGKENLDSSSNIFGKIINNNKIISGLPLLYLTFWYDKMHICRTSYYSSIFKKFHFQYDNKKYIKIKNFIEDSFGHVVKTNIKRHGICGFLNYRCFLLYDDIIPAIGHLDGRSAIDKDNIQLKEKIYQKSKDDNLNRCNIF